MPQQSFSAQVGAWVRKTKGAEEAVFKESTQRIIEIMQTPVAKGGNMPVDTGFLRSSLQAGLNSPQPGPTDNPGGTFSYNPGDVALIIASADLGDTIYATYSANYARPVEYGANGRAGRRFVGLAAQRWQSTVSAVALEARRRVGR